MSYLRRQRPYSLHIRLNKDELESLRMSSTKNGLTVSEYVRYALERVKGSDE